MILMVSARSRHRAASSCVASRALLSRFCLLPPRASTSADCLPRAPVSAVERCEIRLANRIGPTTGGTSLHERGVFDASSGGEGDNLR